MKITIEQIPPEQPEELLIRCHDPKALWTARKFSLDGCGGLA